jgi:hypothetical protein
MTSGMPVRRQAQDALGIYFEHGHELGVLKQNFQLEAAHLAIALTPPTEPPASSLEYRMALQPDAESPYTLLAPEELRQLEMAKGVVAGIANLAFDGMDAVGYRPVTKDLL